MTTQEHRSGFDQRLAHITQSFSLRSSARFHRPVFYQLKSEMRNIPLIPLRKLCVAPICSGIPPVYSDDGEGFYVSLRQLSPNRLDLSEAKKVDREFTESCTIRARLRRGDILVALAGEGTIGKIAVYDSAEPAVLSNFVGRIRLKHPNVPSVIAYILRGELFQAQVEREKAGMGNLTNLYPSTLANFVVPVVPASVQVALAERIAGIEETIADAQSRVITREEIINQILCTEIGFPLEDYREARQQKFTATLSAMAAGFTLRNSSKFHNPKFELTARFFGRAPHERVKAYLAVPIRLGATATKPDFVDEGAAYYAHPGATKRQEVIVPHECHQVTDEFYAATQRRFGLRPRDIIINRSGEALGKVAMWDCEELAVASDFTMRVRFDQERMNPYFAWFFFRSVMFQSQIERELRGSSVPNIFPPEVEQMLIVACNRSKQDALARDITADLQRRTNTLASIESKRDEITRLIEHAISLLRPSAG